MGIVQRHTHHVNVVGLLGIETTAPLITTTIVDALKNQCSVNLIQSRPGRAIQAAFTKDLPFDPHLISINSRSLAPISLLTDVICYKNKPFYHRVPRTHIRLAYSMFEATKLPSSWVSALNSGFDAVIVPDNSLVNIYTQSGVKIPIFVIPLPVYLDEMLTFSPHRKRDPLFVFGISAGFAERKNYEILLEAFSQEFGSNPHVMLKIHGSWGDPRLVKSKIAALGLKNVELMHKTLSKAEYARFMASLDCYVFLSMGEGYSLTPRQALALGIPCIISNHTVHTALCALKSVISISTPLRVRAYFREMGEYCGYFNQCEVSRVREGLRSMYTNYNYYLSQAQEGREWVKHYKLAHLAPYFVTIIKPSALELGRTNIITPGKITTTSRTLYMKYKKLYPNLSHNLTRG
jgi:glycosyltransferase involved in cell wall biosynthesis